MFQIEFVAADGTRKIEKVETDGKSTLNLLDIAMERGIDIDHACGGVCACSTCHVIVRQGLSSCSEQQDDEADQLDKAPGVTLQSRLACQTVPSGKENLVVEIPSWNRNLVREGR